MASLMSFNDNGLNVHYFPKFFEKQQADVYLEQLKMLPFFIPTFKIRGRNAKPKRQVYAFGDTNTSYTFSGTTIQGEPWTPFMLQIRDRVEKNTGCTFNYVLLNLYTNGFDYISHHKDNETDLSDMFPIAVVSFGAERTIEFKRPKVKTTSIRLQHGSMYRMDHPTNELYTHGIPQEVLVNNIRISLTFRHLIPTPFSPPLKKLKLSVDNMSPTQDISVSLVNSTSSQESVNDPTLSTGSSTPESSKVNESSHVNESSKENSTSVNKTSKVPPQDHSSQNKKPPHNTSDEQRNDFSNDCNSQLIQEESQQNPEDHIKGQWNLNGNTFLQIIMTRNFNLRIHIRKINQLSSGELSPTREGIVMSLTTWSHFQESLRKFKFLSVHESFVSNNQLLTTYINSECCYMQQMFPLNSKGFYLKPAVLTLNKEEFFNLIELSPIITKSLIEIKFLKVIPALVSRQPSECRNHRNTEDAHQHYQHCILTAIRINAEKLFECEGCFRGFTSQLDHECIMKPTSFKFFSNEEAVLLSFNHKQFVENVVTPCNCHYKEDFFNSLNMSFYDLLLEEDI